MTEQNAAPWTLTCHPAEVAACTAATRFSISRGTWTDPILAALLAPPVTVTVVTIRRNEAAVLLRQPGRRRAPGGPFEPRRRRCTHLAVSGPGARPGLTGPTM